MLPVKLKSGLYRLIKTLTPFLPAGILESLAQWYTRHAHEPDFEIFERMEGTKALVMDVGACRGQSALSILRRTKRMRVISFEPNPDHRWSLLTIALLHPFRFRFRMLAAGDSHGHATLHIPGKRASGLSAQSSLDPAEFSKKYVQERLAMDGFDATDLSGFRQVDVRIVPLDELNLAVDMIKLDVEGYESQALNGLRNVLCRRKPALLIEVNNMERWLPQLEELGYAFYHYDPVNGMLEPAAAPGEKLNLFCIHPASETRISRILLQNVKTYNPAPEIIA